MQVFFAQVFLQEPGAQDRGGFAADGFLQLAKDLPQIGDFPRGIGEFPGDTGRFGGVA